MRVVLVTIGMLGLFPVAVALAALVGLGVVRGLPAWQVGAVAALVTMLPIAGIWGLLGRRDAGLVFGQWAWPLILIAGLPGYFPGEVPGAVGTGFAVFAAPGGPDLSARASRLGEPMGPVAAVIEGQAPPETAERALPDCAPSAVPSAGDQVALPYEGQGHSLLIPVQFGESELPMLFDTGATVTTLDTASLTRLGVTVPADAPTITLRTANGERTARLVLLPKVWVGGLPVAGVTIGVCEECADDKSSGLLGLNVSSQFLVTLDTARREVVFQAREGGMDRLIDVGPWLKVQATATLFPDTRVEVRVVAENLSGREVSQADVGITCGDDRFMARLTDIAAHSTGVKDIALPRGTQCDVYKVSLDHARW